MTEKFWSFKNKASENNNEEEKVELRIDGEIIDDQYVWLYEWFGIPNASKNAFREELKNYKGQDITVWVDSPGGSVFAATGMYNALMEHTGNITVKVEQAMSAATIPVMAGDERYVSPLALMMIHNPVTRAEGDARVMTKTAEVLNTVKETIINAYMRSGKTREEISQMMDDETWMSANVAVKEGFADDVLYQEEPIAVSNIKDFSYHRLNIVNRVEDDLKKIIEIENKNNNSKKEGEDKVEIKNIEDLRNAYPEYVSEIEDNARQEGAEQERTRIKDIDDIQDAIGNPELVAKAKYEEPMDARDLTFEAAKADKKKGKEHLENTIEDNNNSGANDVKAGTGNDGDDKPKTIEDKTRSIAAQFDAKRRGVNING